MFKEYNFSPGIVTFNNYDIDVCDKLDYDNINLTEDMLQVEFGDELVLDVGWYSAIDKFIVYVIKNCDWEKPVLKIQSDSYVDLKASLDQAMSLIRELLK